MWFSEIETFWWKFFSGELHYDSNVSPQSIKSGVNNFLPNSHTWMYPQSRWSFCFLVSLCARACIEGRDDACAITYCFVCPHAAGASKWILWAPALIYELPNFISLSVQMFLVCKHVGNTCKSYESSRQPIRPPMLSRVIEFVIQCKG